MFNINIKENILFNNFNASLIYLQKNKLFGKYIKEYGYSENEINSAFSLLESSRKISSFQSDQIKIKSESVAELNKKKSFAKKIYMRHLKIARILFENNAHITKVLELNGKRATKISDFVNQVKSFYENALESDIIKAGLKQNGITKVSLNEGLNLINDVSQYLRVVERAKSEALKSTQEKKLNLKEVYAWYSKFVKISKIALEDNPQELKKFIEVIKNN